MDVLGLIIEIYTKTINFCFNCVIFKNPTITLGQLFIYIAIISLIVYLVMYLFKKE